MQAYAILQRPRATGPKIWAGGHDITDKVESVELGADGNVLTLRDGISRGEIDRIREPIGAVEDRATERAEVFQDYIGSDIGMAGL
jgi:hypothetical protein